ncbi:TPA: DUF1120 domain-containing protein [Serratia marcescens]
MKKTLVISSLFAACALSLNVQAAPMSADISVKGSMSVPGCSIEQANGNGVYDLGKISSTLIQQTKETKLQEMGLRWGVTCDAATYLSFQVVDDREGTASKSGTTNFGLGTVNDGGKLGYYSVKMHIPTVDGKTAKVYSTAGSTFTAVDSVLLDKGKKMGWATSSNIQAAGKSFAAFLAIAPVLASQADMKGPVTENDKLDGSLTMNFSFGI